MADSQVKFNKILEEAENDPNIIGFWVGGSRGKGMVTQYSDYDCVVVVKDEVLDEYKKKYKELEDQDFEFWVKTLQIFRDHAELGTEHAWDRYNFSHTEPLVDKTGGEIKKLFQEKGVLPQEKIKDFVSDNLDGYINKIYRSLKCFRDGDNIAAQLEAAESISYLLNVMFGLEGRLKPYYKYLQWELKNYSLEKLPWTPDIFLEKIMFIAKTADISTQQEILRTIEPIFRSGGYGDILDGWKEKLDWMKNYS